MKVGDRVSWCSQAGGMSLRKVGTIVQVLEVGQTPNLKDLGGTHSIQFDSYNPRRKVSYLISVKQKEGRKPKLYWPKARVTLRQNADGTKPSLIVEPIPSQKETTFGPDVNEEEAYF